MPDLKCQALLHQAGGLVRCHQVATRITRVLQSPPRLCCVQHERTAPRHWDFQELIDPHELSPSLLMQYARFEQEHLDWLQSERERLQADLDATVRRTANARAWLDVRTRGDK